MSVLIIGDVGVLDGMFHIGDEAMFEVAVDELSERGLSPIGVSSNPPETAARYGIPALPRLGFAGLDRAEAARRADHLLAVAAGSAELSPDDPAAEVFATLEGARLLVNAGGGNLATRWHSHVFERTTLARVARAKGVPVAVTGQTLGPDLDTPDDVAVARMLREAALVGVREPDTAALVDSWGLSATLNVDDASFLGLGAAGETGASASRGGVVVSLSGWFAGRPADQVEQHIAELADAAARTVGPVAFHAHFGPLDPAAPPRGDAALHERIRQRMSEPSIVIPTGTSREAAALVRGAALLITGRYHPAVFAAPAGTPVLALSADQYTRIKLGGALGHWGQTSVLDLDELPGAPRRLETLVADTAAIRAEAAARLPRLRAASRQWWDRVAASVRN
ncbi:polysaccharide pyruvyl transferase family protein [Microbacterium schleiferi]|uniref:polysaccharide pyruvyl transferase family protein n=1 Tax=Microbacterium schleiferi TaxID=69362 RepID=UPI00311DF3D8